METDVFTLWDLLAFVESELGLWAPPPPNERVCDLPIDSFALLELVIAVEDHFGVIIDDEHLLASEWQSVYAVIAP